MTDHLIIVPSQVARAAREGRITQWRIPMDPHPVRSDNGCWEWGSCLWWDSPSRVLRYVPIKPGDRLVFITPKENESAKFTRAELQISEHMETAARILGEILDSTAVLPVRGVRVQQAGEMRHADADACGCRAGESVPLAYGVTFDPMPLSKWANIYPALYGVEWTPGTFEWVLDLEGS